MLATAAGCGGGNGASPQDAEAHVRATFDEQKGIQVRSLFCDAVSGERFMCEVTWKLAGVGGTLGVEHNERIVVEAAEVE